MNYLFTSESVSEGHPDKVSDQISDALLDEFLARDPNSHVAIETLCTTGQVVVAGEVTSQAYVDIPATTRNVINNIGYNRGAYRFDADSLGLLSAIHEQSADINRGVSRSESEENSQSAFDLQGAGDQGMMFGYAVDETGNATSDSTFMPVTLELSHRILLELAKIRRDADAMTYYRKGKLASYLRPDAKSQVTVEYDENNRPVRIHTIVVSTQHDEFVTPLTDSEEAQKKADSEMHDIIYRDVRDVLIPRVKASLPEDLQRLFDDNLILHVNPTGKFVIGGPHGDTGLTGRKIIVDTYGGRGAHGGGAFSGKDPSKVDRSAAYACRHIAKNLVAAGVAREVLVQVAYAIGKAKPVSLFINTFGTAKVPLTDAQIAERINEMEIFDMRPAAIERRLKLRNPIYLETASYGHFGRRPQKVKKLFKSRYEDTPIERDVELFTWENLDAVDAIKKEFSI